MIVLNLAVLLIIIGAGIALDTTATLTPAHGDDITLECPSTGSLASDMLDIWVFNVSDSVCTTSDCTNGIPVINTTLIGDKVIATTQTLQLSNVNASMNGGTHACVSVNSQHINVSIFNIYFKPKILIKPADVNINVTVNEDVIITCNVDAYPYPALEWQKNTSGTFEEIVGQNTSELILPQVSFDESGTYRCIASNTINSTIHTAMEDFNLNVRSVSPAGTVTTDREKYLVEQGASVTITCTGSGGIRNIIKWFQNENEIFNGTNDTTIVTSISEAQTTSVLLLENIDARSSKGEYICQVDNDEGLGLAKAVVIVSPAGLTEIIPDSVIATFNSNATLECTTEAGPNTKILWLFRASKDLCVTSTNCNPGDFNITEATRTLIAQGPIMSIQNISSNKAGEYACFAVNDAGDELVSVTVNLLPIILTELQDVMVSLNDSVSFECIVDGFPTPSIVWQKLVNKEFIELEENGTTLVIDPIQRDSTGLYRCLAYNTINGAMYSAMANATLLVSYVDDVKFIPESNNTFKAIKQGDRLELTCQALGGPDNIFRWTLNGEDVLENDVISIVTILQDTFGNSTLTVNSVNAIEHKGNYTCQVMNNEVMKSASIVVVVSPEGIVAVSPEDMISSVGSNVTFRAQTDAGPGTYLVWIHDPANTLCVDESSECFAVNLFNFSDYAIISTNYMFTLVNVNGSNDGGRYIFVALNDAGFEVVIINLYFLPQFLEEPQDIVTRVNKTVTLSVVVDGYPFPNIQWQRLVDGEFENVTGETKSTLQFDSITFSDAAVYRCVIYSTVNNTDYVIASRSILLSVILQNTTMIEGSDGFVNQGEELYLICTSPGGPGVDIQWIYEGKNVVQTESINVTTVFAPTKISSSLRISSIDAASHKGSYVCLVSSPSGNDSTSIVVVVSPSGIVNVMPPEDLIVNRGDNFSLSVMTEAGPETSYYWIRDPLFTLCFGNNADCVNLNLNGFSNYSIISTNPDLRFENFTGKENGGRYFSVVMNDAGFEVIVRNVYMLPLFVKEPEDIITKVNETIVLSVAVDGSPFPSIQWQKLENGLFTDLNGQNQPLFMIESVNYTDAGVYRCVLTSTINSTVRTTISKETTVSVSLEGTAIIEGSNGLVEQNEEVWLMCNAQGGPNNTYQWLHDGVPVIESSSLNVSTVNYHSMSTSTLRISSVDAATHKGNYTCIVSNKAGQDVTSIIVVVSPVGISIVTPVSDVIASPGDNVTFTATSDAGPDTVFTWQFACSDETSSCNSNANVNLTTGVATVSSVSEMVTVNSAVLYLTNVSVLDNGKEYIATIENNAGTETVTKSVFFLPRINEQPVENVITDANQPVVLSISFSGFPFPSAQWQKSDMGNFENLPGQNQTTLEFSSIDYSDAGVYRCVISTTINGTDYTIESQETIITISLQGAVSITNRTVFVEEGDVFSSTCSAQGGPNNTHKWTLNGIPINETDILDITTVSHDTYSTSTLTIDSVDAANHKGNYTCIVSNKAGTDTTSVILVVSPVGIVHVFPPDTIATVGDNITFIANTEAGPGNTFYWIFDPNYSLCVSDCADTINEIDYSLYPIVSNDSILTLVNANGSNDGGRYIFVALNDAGFEVVIRNLYFLPQFLEEPQDIVTRVNETVTLSVVVDGYPFPNIQWQRLMDGEFVDLIGENETILLFPSIQFSDAGVYRCIISNIINGTAEEKFSKEAILSVSLEDTAVLEGSDGLSKQGDELVLICNANGGPNNTYRWLLNGEDIVETDVLSISTVTYHTMSTSELRISSIDAAVHKGNYICLVSNSAGNDSTSIVVTVSPKGTVSITPVNSTLQRGDDITFSCQTDAGPDTHIVWFHNASEVYCNSSNCYNSWKTNGSIISTEKTFTLYSITAPLNGGTYTCVAINNAGIEVSHSVLNIEPEFLEQPQSVNTTVNMIFDLKCIVEAFPFPSVQWQKIDNVSGLYEDIDGENGTVFVIDTSNPAITGVYRCQAQTIINGIQRIINSTDARVAITLVGTVSLIPQEILVDYGSNLTLKCSVSGGPNNIFEWFVGGSRVKSSTERHIEITSSEFDSILTIDFVSAPLHGGTFECSVSNAISRDSIGTTVFIKPRFLEFPTTILAQNGTNQQLNCTAESYPHPSYQWSYRNSTISITNKSLLTFVPIHYDDKGYYTCYAESYGTTISSDTVAIYVSPEGSVETDPVINAIPDDTIELICTAQGGPDNQFSWTDLTTGDILELRSDLTITDITILDGGDYQCNVSNKAGHEAVIATVNIKSEIIESPEAVNVSIFVDPIDLMCAARGFPIPAIVWIHNDQVLNETDRINTTTEINEEFNEITSILTVYDTVLSDTGLYHCIALNLPVYQPVASDKVIVLVQDVPNAPYNISSVDISSRQLTLKWTAPDDNNSPILGYYIFYKNPAFLNGSGVVLETNGSIENIQINDLHPGTVYTFTVVAFNSEGNSSNQTFDVRTLEEAPIGAPIDLKGIAVSSTEIFIIWSPPMEIDRLGTIISFDISLEGFDMNDTLVDSFVISNVTGRTNFTINDLEEYTDYDISVRARTSVGPGPYSTVISVLTNESMPGPVKPPSVISVNRTSAEIEWDEPDDPNGVILQYIIEFAAQRFTEEPYQERKRQIDESLQMCFDHLGRNDTVINVQSPNTNGRIDNLLPFTTYEVKIAAITIAGLGEYSIPTVLSTLPSNPGEIVNLAGTTKNATSLVIAWDSPPCPFSVITGHQIHYTTENVSHEQLDDENNNYTTSEIISSRRSNAYHITGLVPMKQYNILVRAFSNSGHGPVLESIALILDERNNNIGVVDTTYVDQNSIAIMFPSITSLFSEELLNNTIYYGVVVVEENARQNPFDHETGNFDATYPDLGPYQERGDKEYYIAAAWNEIENIPSNYVIGDRSTTTAINQGMAEEYYNAELKSSTDYCYYILSMHLFIPANEIINRVTFINCTKTEPEPIATPIWIIIVPIVLVLLLLLCILLCCIICLLCCCVWRKKKKQSDEDGDRIHCIPLQPLKKKEAEKKPISIIDFPLHVRRMHENQDYPFSKEFEHIEPIHDPTYEASLRNKDKNRFSSLPAYDHSRVVLESNPSDSDYINANYISGVENLGNFIATQGPIENTVGDFWWMVWEKHIPMIIMLTNLEEKGKLKCHQYWPVAEKISTKFGSIVVTILSEAVQAHHIIRTFTLEYEMSSEVKSVTQYHYTSWPDHGVPKSTESLLQLIEFVRNAYQPHKGPILVHCGTGAGRTGAFIALYVMLARLTKSNTVDIYNYVQYMRKQRISMVSNETEYIFVHDALVDALREGMIQGYILGLDSDVPEQTSK